MAQDEQFEDMQVAKKYLKVESYYKMDNAIFIFILQTRLSRRYRIKSGVPTLVLLDKDGSTVSISAHERLVEDPNGTNFPWRPRPVDEVSTRFVCLYSLR